MDYLGHLENIERRQMHLYSLWMGVCFFVFKFVCSVLGSESVRVEIQIGMVQDCCRCFRRAAVVNPIRMDTTL